MFKKISKRTGQQNRSLHKLYRQLADDLNREGYDVRIVLEVLAREGMDMQWTEHLVKELWRLIQIANTGKKSTTELDSINDINVIYEALNKFLSQNFYIHRKFPSLETLMEEDGNN